MEPNLFFDVLSVERQTEINTIKHNKAFASKLVNDLNKVFYTHFEIEDQQEGSIIYMKRGASYGRYGSFMFIADKNGIRFKSRNLGYYKNSPFKNMGELYERYKNVGTTADTTFLEDKDAPHGFVNFLIPINENDQNLNQTLKDIVYLMEQDQFIKRF